MIDDPAEADRWGLEVKFWRIFNDITQISLAHAIILNPLMHEMNNKASQFYLSKIQCYYYAKVERSFTQSKKNNITFQNCFYFSNIDLNIYI